MDGEQLGVVLTSDALDRAEEYGLDLMEVAPNSDPPVCKIVNYGKLKYEGRWKNGKKKWTRDTIWTEQR